MATIAVNLPQGREMIIGDFAYRDHDDLFDPIGPGNSYVHDEGAWSGTETTEWNGRLQSADDVLINGRTAIKVRNETLAIITRGQFVKVVGESTTEDARLIELADATAVGNHAWFVVPFDIAINDNGLAYTADVETFDTSTQAFGDIVFLSDTPGGISFTPGTTQQTVGVVLEAAVSGRILFNVLNPDFNPPLPSLIAQSLIPAIDDTFDIGETGTPLRWRNFFSRHVTFNATINSFNPTFANVDLTAFGTAALKFMTFDASAGTLTVSSDAGSVDVLSLNQRAGTSNIIRYNEETTAIWQVGRIGSSYVIFNSVLGNTPFEISESDNSHIFRDNTGGVIYRTFGSTGQSLFGSSVGGSGVTALVQMQADVTTAPGSVAVEVGQLLLCGLTNSAKRLGVGFDTTSDFGYIQAAERLIDFRPLMLQPYNTITATAGVYIGTVKLAPANRNGLIFADNGATDPSPALLTAGIFAKDDGGGNTAMFSVTDAGLVAPFSTSFINLSFQYDTNTTMADPGAGNFRLNNAVTSLVAEMAFSKTNFSGISTDSFPFTVATVGTRVAIRQQSDHLRAVIYVVTSITDNVTWVQVEVTLVAAGTTTTLQNNAECDFGVG